ncbi:alpha/beta fold hydrolase [Spiractinospora alimapuensis]|uniref:alpha/beta fold hydrolase n=1 Tax=Spiractinospora alimapuensis TaxID=2820884 RepID=UPI001F169561|nr:alpha/beta fold hydrolase [Spiractinospora alimapuensis]QVQ50561.1 alpha/beta fold hydrolase [Spiractinospora alimapuensis]
MDPRAIAYDRQGSGPTLLLLHGLGHERTAWRPVVSRLADAFDCVSVDLPGFGESPAPEPTAPYDIATLLDSLLDFCRHLGLHDVHVAGNSLGGALALELGSLGAARSVTALAPVGFSSGRARRLALIGALATGSHVPPAVRQAAARSAPGRMAARLALHGAADAPTAHDATFRPEALDPRSPFARLAKEVIRYTFTAAAPRTPVSIGWGDHDRVLSPRQAQRASRLIPHARFVLLLNAGHLCMVDAPHATAATIRETCAYGEATYGPPRTRAAPPP